MNTRRVKKALSYNSDYGSSPTKISKFENDASTPSSQGSSSQEIERSSLITDQKIFAILGRSAILESSRGDRGELIIYTATNETGKNV